MTQKAKERLLESAMHLISEKGFNGVSIREICDHADTGINMIHHYFESKEGLLHAILEKFNAAIVVGPMRILQKPVSTKEAFTTRLLLFVEETLEALIDNRYALKVSCDQQKNISALAQHQQSFIAFLETGKKQGFVRETLDTEMISGFLMDRLINQVQYVATIKDFSSGDILNDEAYRHRWCKANIDVFLNGILI